MLQTGRTGPSQLGFTLIELLVVIGILALVMTLVPSIMPGVQAKAELKSATREIATSLRETRGLAIASGRTTAFTLDTKGGEFLEGTARRPHHLPKSVRSTLFTTTEEVLDEGVGAIRFFADGSSTGGGVRLVQGQRRYDVLVDWLTGRISIGEANPGS